MYRDESQELFKCRTQRLLLEAWGKVEMGDLRRC